MTAAPDTRRGTIPVFTSARGEAEVRQAYEAVLDAWPVPHDDVVVPTSVGQTHVVVSGDVSGPPVVLLHAFMATAASWYRTVGALADSYRTYAVDIVGDANPSRPTRPIGSLEDYTVWFEEVLDGLGLDSVHVVGNSVGAFIATHLAMQLPARVRSLVIIGPAATIHRMPAFYTHLWGPKALQLLVPRLPGMQDLVDRGVDWIHAGQPPDPLWGPLFLATMRHGRPINRVFPRVFTAEELARVRAPVLVVLGECERIYDPGAAAVAARRLLPGADVRLVADAHHLTALSRPDKVNPLLLAFLDGRGRDDPAGVPHADLSPGTSDG